MPTFIVFGQITEPKVQDQKKSLPKDTGAIHVVVDLLGVVFYKSAEGSASEGPAKRVPLTNQAM